MRSSASFKNYEYAHGNVYDKNETINYETPEYQTSSWRDHVGSQIENQAKKRFQFIYTQLDLMWERLKMNIENFNPNYVTYNHEETRRVIDSLCIEE